MLSYWDKNSIKKVLKRFIWRVSLFCCGRFWWWSVFCLVGQVFAVLIVLWVSWPFPILANGQPLDLLTFWVVTHRVRRRLLFQFRFWLCLNISKKYESLELSLAKGMLLSLSYVSMFWSPSLTKFTVVFAWIN